MSRGRVPNVNASLIHEVRMLAQHFLAGRQLHSYAAPFTEMRKKKAPVLRCGFCIKDALFVINGWSVCVVHEDKARGATNTPRFPGE